MNAFTTHLETTLQELRETGLYKTEREISSPQSGRVVVQQRDRKQEVINLCANNYLGLANHPDIVNAARDAITEYGYGLASVRFICGTQTIHRELERKLAAYLQKDDAILFAACFDANGGLFEPLLSDQDAIVSDSLNHASIIDGIRLCKARRYRFANNDMEDLESNLKQARRKGARHIMIATDGVFSMDGYLANLPDLTDLATRYDAQVMVDDCHSTGVLGPEGRGTASHFDVEDKVDILTGTFGKALGGGLGGYVAGPQAVVDILRQRARPYLFSNTLPPAIVAASITAIDLVKSGTDLRTTLSENKTYWREQLEALGFTLLKGDHPIIPVMIEDAKLAQEFAAELYRNDVYATAFAFPVVPRGRARIRTQMSAALNRDDLDRALGAFHSAGQTLGIIS
ncbi:MAG: glycine C-acetyltransferase [Pseudomonadota bacterium]